MSDVRYDFWGAETRVGDSIMFIRPRERSLGEGKVIRLTPKRVTVEYERWPGHMDRCFVAERQFARKPEEEQR